MRRIKKLRSSWNQGWTTRELLGRSRVLLQRMLFEGVRQPSLRAIIMCVIVGLVASTTVVAVAQGRRGQSAQRARAQRAAQLRARRRRARQRARQRAQKQNEAQAGERQPGEGVPQKNAGREAERVPRPEAGGGDDSEIVQSAREIGEEGSKVKVMEFTGLDISGRLKSPSLLYFLNRVRTEFDRPTLPHRSFIPEVKRSSNERPFEE